MHPERRPNPDQSPEALEARLRALPQPPVPAGLEARLLAGIPAELPILPSSPTLSPREGKGWARGRRGAVWVGAASALAAACLLAVLVRRGRDGKDPVPSSEQREFVHQVPAHTADDSAGIGVLLATRRVLAGAEMPAFTWPLQETSPLRASPAIPRDLLE